ncbi:TetR/AcrR family transcriptional regulator [Pediococcus ethanolidurans]|uniref:TetR/AcrR family transcriptional regulator n=1 Tax=Pediococcus ethanolidurans TaxID=319653 RepID=UPI0029535471|nr:TetR/AcrR family transcriptional regulator [Pediococcus ethanolidurans]
MDRKAKLTIILNHIILTRGFSTLSMAQLAKLAGVSRATLYLYFKNKGEIVSAVTKRHIDFISKQMQVNTENNVSVYQNIRLSMLLLTGSVSEIFLAELRREYPEMAQQLEESTDYFEKKTSQKLRELQQNNIISEEVDIDALVLQDSALVTASIRKALNGEWSFEQIKTVFLNYFVSTMKGTVSKDEESQLNFEQTKAFQKRIFSELYATFYKRI